MPEDRPVIEVLNKIDLLEAGPRRGLEAKNGRDGAYAVSALSGAGIPELLEGFEASVTRGNIDMSLKLGAEDGAGLAFAYRYAQVLERRDRAGKITSELADFSTGPGAVREPVFRKNHVQINGLPVRANANH